MLKRLKERKDRRKSLFTPLNKEDALDLASSKHSGFDDSGVQPTRAHTIESIQPAAFGTLPRNYKQSFESIALNDPQFAQSEKLPIQRKRTASGGAATLAASAYLSRSPDEKKGRELETSASSPYNNNTISPTTSRRMKRRSLPAAAIGRLNPFKGEDEGGGGGEEKKKGRVNIIDPSSKSGGGFGEEDNQENSVWRMVRMVRNKDEENEVLKTQIAELQIKVSQQQKEIDYHKNAAKQLTSELESLKSRLEEYQNPSVFSLDLDSPHPNSARSTSSTTLRGSAPTSARDFKLKSPTPTEGAERVSKLKAYLAYSNLEFKFENGATSSSSDKPKPDGKKKKKSIDINARAEELIALHSSDSSDDASTPHKVFHQKTKKKGSRITFIREDRMQSDSSAEAKGPYKPLILKAPGHSLEREVNYDWTKAHFVLERESWYEQYFFRFAHRNFIGVDTPLGTVIVSTKKEGVGTEIRPSNSPGHNPNEEGHGVYRVVVLTQDGDQNLLIPSNSVEVSGNVSSFKLLHAINPLLLSTGKIKEITNPQFSKALLDFENKDRPKKYKFGVLLAKEGQTTEQDMFSNKEGSQDYQEFLDIIGNEVRLEGFKNFAGGLDVKTNTTGTHSRFIKWKGNQIMWHVSTCLPHSDMNPQQLERKRHIGNDIVLVVFLDGNVQFSPKTVSSHFIHNIIAVRRLKDTDEDPDNISTTDHSSTTGERTTSSDSIPTTPRKATPSTQKVYRYQITVCSKDDVPLFGPPLPKPSIFTFTEDEKDSFRDFLLAKLINSDLAAQASIYFSKKLRVGRRAILNELALTFFPNEAEESDVP